MKKTLKLTERLLDLGRLHLDRGRDQEALHVLGKLATFGQLPAKVAEDAEAHLADLYFKQRKFKKARRHLQAALGWNPDCPRYHYLMATILEEEDTGDVDRLLHHYQQAVELAPTEPEYLCDYGLFLIDAGETEEGLKHLELAVECAEEDSFKYVQLYALNQMEAGYAEQARRTVIAAMFRNSRDARLKKLWDDLNFREAQCTQRRYSPTASLSEMPVLLPFRAKKIAGKKQPVHTDDGSIIRLDPPTAERKPHTQQRMRKR